MRAEGRRVDDTTPHPFPPLPSNNSPVRPFSNPLSLVLLCSRPLTTPVPEEGGGRRTPSLRCHVSLSVNLQAVGETGTDTKSETLFRPEEDLEVLEPTRGGDEDGGKGVGTPHSLHTKEDLSRLRSSRVESSPPRRCEIQSRGRLVPELVSRLSYPTPHPTLLSRVPRDPREVLESPRV